MTEGELAGRWEKATDSACAGAYPDELELDALGGYRGRMAEGSPFHPMWDGGSWSVADGTLRISLANDAVVDYPFVLEDGSVRLVDPSGCELLYRRVE